MAIIKIKKYEKNMKNFNLYNNSILIVLFFLQTNFLISIDLTIVGNISMGDGLGKIAINFIKSCKQKCSINWVPSQGLSADLTDLPNDIIDIINNTDKNPGAISILTDIPWCKYGTFADNVSDNSLIKIAYSMLETNKIPIEWVNIFNNKFDAVLVPDQYYANVYNESGVTIPIFVLPISMDLDKFYDFSDKKINKVEDVFTFGNTSSLWPHKNVELLIKAFSIAFSKNPKVRLLINSRHVEPGNGLSKALKKAKNARIEFTNKKLTDLELLDFLSKIDCFVSFSRGEGFSLCPRECLAMGIPCIVSNNTAHKTICDSGFVRSTDSNLLVKANYRHLPSDTGYQFDTKLKDAVSALLDVYNNYLFYKNKALNAKNWVDQFSFNYLKEEYCNLVSPKNILLGSENKITDSYLMTNSTSLYKKYLQILKK
jgi:glycosyltransferase involved in cell wall biosynthesis